MPDSPRLIVDRVVANGSDAPERWLLILHGIYGAGRNWASVARRFVRARPSWGVGLVDLRQHGGSRGFEPPHTVSAAAADVVRAAREEGLAVGAVLGHSFGGKVALLVARAGLEGLEQVWIVDSTPDTREPGGSAWDMVGLLRRNPGPFANREDGVEALVDAGVEPDVARWMATNLEEREGTHRWRLDPDAMEALLRSFFAEDAWDVVESPPEGVSVHLVKARSSSVLEGTALARVEAAQAGGRVAVHPVDGGHWVNADNPDALHHLLVEHLG